MQSAKPVSTPNLDTPALNYRFPLEDLKVRVMRSYGDNTKGHAAVYTDARAVMDALDTLYPNWSVEIKELQPTKSGESQVAVTLIVEGEFDDPYGRERMVTDVGVHSDAKNATSDGLKRAAMNLGIGRYLWEAGEQYVTGLKPGKKSGQAYFQNHDQEKKVIWNAVKKFYDMG